jgi:hypothetical protein
VEPSFTLKTIKSMKIKLRTKAYEPTPREREALAAQRARRMRRKPSPNMTVTDKKGVAQIEVDHPDSAVGSTLLMEALGTAEPDFL